MQVQKGFKPRLLMLGRLSPPTACDLLSKKDKSVRVQFRGELHHPDDVELPALPVKVNLYSSLPFILLSDVLFVRMSGLT